MRSINRAERRKQLEAQRRRNQIRRQLAEHQQKKIEDAQKLEKKKQQEEKKQQKKERMKRQYYNNQKAKLLTYKKQMEEHITKMSLGDEYGQPMVQNTDLIIARDDLTSLHDSMKFTDTPDTNQYSVSILDQMSNGNQRVNRKPAVS